jgi:SAM-dependent MidA family methyltransferase
MALLPIPDAESQAISQQLVDLIQQKIKENKGWIDFATFMHMALYTPNLGYYSGGTTKFGMDGDFVTAPEISPLFAKTLALQAKQILACMQGDILELGAGTGKLASDLLLELAQLNHLGLGSLPRQYFILEVSAYLRQIQRETLHKILSADLFERVVWLDALPKSFKGLVLGNEVLDAIPVHLIHYTPKGRFERGVSFDGDFIWRDQSENQAATLSVPNLTKSLPNDLPQNYLTEICPAASALVGSLAEMLEIGVILLIDYGFSAREYYHPQRNTGTLMCHYQHYAHSNPLINVGLQDITAHVDFTQIALSAESHGMKLAGYVNQAQFLINCGILDVLGKTSPSDMATYVPLAAAAQKLLSPAEMGELFKVIALTKSFDEPLIGFKDGDKSHTL